MHTQAIRQ